MDGRQYQFLASVLGDDGAGALKKATERSAELEHALVPRAILAWIGTVRRSYEGGLPGIDESYVRFEKGEGERYSGSVAIDGQVYNFMDSQVEHLAAAVAVALGVDHRVARGLRDIDIDRLGISIDLLARAKEMSRDLAKSEKIKCAECGASIYQMTGGRVGFHSLKGKKCPGSGKEAVLEKQSMGGAAGGTATPGKSAAPIKPKAPTAPTSVAEKFTPEKPKISKPVTPKAAKPAIFTPKPLAGAKPSLGAKPSPTMKSAASYTLKVTKAESEGVCPVCGGYLFHGKVFGGCHCFVELAKFATATWNGDGFDLALGEEWDRDALMTFLETLGRE